VDGITHLDEKVIDRDKIRQQELEIAGVSFLRFDALLVINKVEAVCKEIERWISEYERKYGVSDFVKSKRIALEKERARKWE
jgi:very-short-patch-repair endonuclease